VFEFGKGGRTVSATEIVSLRSLRRVATSWTICRNSSGGKAGGDIVPCSENWQRTPYGSLKTRKQMFDQSQLISDVYMVERIKELSPRGNFTVVT
jgi:hypothetical protein